METIENPLAEYRFITEIPILWGDQDSFGHVNNLAYLRWAESARVEYLMRAAMWMDALPSGIGPILASLHCDYKAQMRFPDTAVVGTAVTRIGNSSMRMEHRIISRNEEQVTAELHSTLVLIDYTTGKPVTVPDSIRSAVGRIEGRSFAPAADRQPERG